MKGELNMGPAVSARGVRTHFQLPGQSPEEKSVTVILGDSLLLATLPVPEHPLGYELFGWSYESAGAIITDAEISVPIGGIDLYAIWNSAVAKEIIYDTQRVPEIKKTIGVPSGTETILPVPPENTFKGWALDPDGTQMIPGATFTPDSDATLYAIWERGSVGEQIFINFDRGEGSGSMDPIIAPRENWVVVPSEFTLPTGKVFVYWENPATGNKFYENQTVTFDEATYGNSVTLVAIFEYSNVYNVTYIRNKNSSDNESQVYTYPAGQFYFPRSFFVNEGHEFKGWSFDRNETYGTIDGRLNLTEDITLYAIWG